MPQHIINGTISNIQFANIKTQFNNALKRHRESNSAIAIQMFELDDSLMIRAVYPKNNTDAKRVIRFEGYLKKLNFKTSILIK